LNAHRAELLDVPRLSAQLCALERRTARGGRDTIDHPPGTHDDLANAVGGVIQRVIGGPKPLIIPPGLIEAIRNQPPYRPSWGRVRRFG
jgi:hypothetical protein